jgi:queuine tRNA-ribosyltransferase
MSDSGNRYELVATVEGVPTFRHLQTGENLHGQAGPWQEAWNLYVGPSMLAARSGAVTIYDVGMGCAAQVLASLNAFEKNPALSRCEVVSFDLEPNGIAALLASIDRFPYAQPYAGILGELLATGEARSERDGRLFVWRFVAGDFRTTIARVESGELPAPDLIFYDFFSPSRHAYLWTHSLFATLFERSGDGALLFTYSSATAVRASLAAAGFFLGYGVPSGKKAKTTIAAKRIADLNDPMPEKWAKTFSASHIPFVAVETPEVQALIRLKMAQHPQFSGGSS